MRAHHSTAPLILSLVCALVACEADHGVSGQNENDALGSSANGNDAKTSLYPMRRLTNVQYRNSVAVAFGPTLVLPTLNVTDLAVDGLTAAGASEVGMPSADAEGYINAAHFIAQQVAGTGFVEHWPCTPNSPADRVCMETILSTIGLRLIRRPLTSGELQTMTAQALNEANDTKNFSKGVFFAVFRLLLHPSFLFRIENTKGQGDDPTAFEAYTLASRLSYFLWDSAPDDALWAAAADNTLLLPSIYQAQVDRLLEDPKSDDALFGFLAEVLQLGDILTAQKDPNVYTQELAQDLFTQANLTIKDLLLTQNADYRQLFVSQQFFINNNLAARYGFPAVDGNGFVKVQFSANDRAGLFGLPGITTMLSPSARTSPTKRGIYIRGALMCTSIPSPPANVDTSVTQDNNNPLTMRQVMSAHATNSACSGCHTLMDPLGFALDGFDWLGRSRTTDRNLPLDLSGSLDGQSFVNARTFGQALHDNDAVTQCFVRKFIAYARGRTIDTRSPFAASVHDAFAAEGYHIKDLARLWATSDSFTHQR